MAEPLSPNPTLNNTFTPTLTKRIGHGGPISPTEHDATIAGLEAKIAELVDHVEKIKTGEYLRTDSIDTAHLTDGKVTQAKMASNSVGDDQLIATGVVAGDYVAPTLTVNEDGRVTAIASGYDAADYPSGSPFVVDETSDPHAWVFLPTPLDIVPNSDATHYGYGQVQSGYNWHNDGTATTQWTIEAGYSTPSENGATFPNKGATDLGWPLTGGFNSSFSRNVKVVGYAPAVGDEAGFPGIPAAAKQVMLLHRADEASLSVWADGGWKGLDVLSNNQSRERICILDVQQSVIEYYAQGGAGVKLDPANVPTGAGHANLVPANHARLLFANTDSDGNPRGRCYSLKIIGYRL